MTMKKTYTITNMECPNCAMILESIEDDLPGIRRVDASYARGQVTVEFDEKDVSEAQVLAEIERKGYSIA
jgi:copper chaperone CopZ